MATGDSCEWTAWADENKTAKVVLQPDERAVFTMENTS